MQQVEPHRRYADGRSVAAERHLWHALRERRLRGLFFARQVPFGDSIVDFFCEDAAVVVEIDGARHDLKPASKAPARGVLERAGLVVLRFSVDDVLLRYPHVRAAIVAACSRGGTRRRTH